MLIQMRTALLQDCQFQASRLTLHSTSFSISHRFFCAIPPALRTSWAASYARIIKSGGVLFTLVYPIHGEREGGPPYSVHPDIYSSLLEKDFELIHRGVPIDQKDTHVGVEEVMIWRRK